MPDNIPLYDVMSFVDKPDLNMKTDLEFIHEWEASLKDDPNTPASSFTIEYKPFIETVQLRNEKQFITIDIESLLAYHDDIARQYVELAQMAAPRSKVSWWNLGPRNIAANTKFDEWSAIFQQRQYLVDAVDFGILGMYFKNTDTVSSWEDRHMLRATEARRLFKDKPIFCTLSPHFFENGKPWEQVPGDLLGEAIDKLAEILVDGIVFWSFEGTNQLQTWDESWPWVQALRDRIGPDGSYQVPA